MTSISKSFFDKFFINFERFIEVKNGFNCKKSKTDYVNVRNILSVSNNNKVTSNVMEILSRKLWNLFLKNIRNNSDVCQDPDLHLIFQAIP